MGIHKIPATVIEVKYLNPADFEITANIPVFPWDDLDQIKASCRRAMPKGYKITSIRKRRKLVTNPLIEKA